MSEVVDFLTVLQAACFMKLVEYLSEQHLVYCYGSWLRMACLHIPELI